MGIRSFLGPHGATLRELCSSSLTFLWSISVLPFLTSCAYLRFYRKEILISGFPLKLEDCILVLEYSQ